MSEDRPAKAYVRAFWIEAVARAGHDGPEPTYMTLCGSAGPEIQLLIDAGVINTTETGAVSAEDGARVIAVESSPDAVLELQKRFPGLKILDHSIHDVISSASPTSWPTGDKRRFCRAKIINLDFDKSLSAETVAGQVVFKDLDVVAKLAQLHGIDEPLDWHLFITYNASIAWSAPVKSAVLAFLRENFVLEPNFRQECEELMGQSLVAMIDNDEVTGIDGISRSEAQALLMAFVPKKIAQLVHNKGWLVRTDRNLRYGGVGTAAPMVTFALSFAWDTRSTATPLAVYRDSVKGVFANVGAITDEGEFVH